MEARNGQYEHRAGNAVPLFRTTSCAAYGMATPDAFPSLRRQPEQKPEPQTSVGDDPEADATRPQQALCARIDAAEPGDWRELTPRPGGINCSREAAGADGVRRIAIGLTEDA
jgi:hypothetical protein